MRYDNLARTAILGTSAALCFAVAGPASAHESSTGSTSGTKTTTAPTLAQQQTWIDAFIAKRQQAIDSYAAQAAADPKLTSTQQAAIAARLAKQRAELNTLKSAVDSATTSDGLHQAIKTALAADGVHGYFGWCGFYGSHQLQGRAHTKPSSAHAPRAKADPGKVTAPSNAVHTVAVRSGQSGAQGSKPAHTARHSDGRGTSSYGDYHGRHAGGDSHGNAGHPGGTGHTGGAGNISHHR